MPAASAMIANAMKRFIEKLLSIDRAWLRAPTT
jgi:hypothetical protein